MVATPQEVEQYNSDMSSLAQLQARVDAYEKKYLPRRSALVESWRPVSTMPPPTQTPWRADMERFRATEPAALKRKADMERFRSTEPKPKADKERFKADMERFRSTEPKPKADKDRFKADMERFRATEPQAKLDVDMEENELAVSPTRQDEVAEDSVAGSEEGGVDIFMEDELAASPTRQEDSAASPSAAPVTESWERGDRLEDDVLYSGEDSDHEEWNPVTQRTEQKREE